MIHDFLAKHSDESYIDYLVRLFENKDRYYITCGQIADLLNMANGNSFGESVYRKYYSAFRDGMEYERSRNRDGVCKKILALSDFHFPFALPKEVFHEYRNDVDYLVLNGDLLDMQGISKFPRAYRVSPMEELIGCRQYLIDLIEYIHPSTVIINKGNHEERVGSYLIKNLDSDIKDLMPDTALDLLVCDGFRHYDKRSRTRIFYEPISEMFDDINITYTGDWWCKIGKTIFAHPLTYTSGMLKTTEKAVNYFLRNANDFDSVVLAHTHKLGMYKDGPIVMYEQGTCSKISNLCYADGKLCSPQQMGFIFVCQDTDGKLIFEQTKLVPIDKGLLAYAEEG